MEDESHSHPQDTYDPDSPWATIDLSLFRESFDRSTMEPLLLVDSHGEIIYTSNGAFPWITANSTNLLNGVHEMDYGNLQDWLQNILKENPYRHGEFVFHLPGGGLTSFEFSGFRCRDEFHQQRVLLFGRQKTSQDQPEFRPASYAVEARYFNSTLKNSVIGNISHELRTPINGIAVATEVLTQTDLDDNQLEMVDCIRDSSRILLGLVEEMADFATITSGYSSFNQEAFSLGEFLDPLHSTFHDTAQQKGLAFLIERDPDIPDDLIGDRNNLWHILSRIVSNAIKFTTEGEVRVRIGNGGIDEHSASIVFEVIDTGIGIERSAMEWICDPFRQVTMPKKNKTRGLGLGLAICQLLAMRVQTRISFESRLGEGSRFWFPFRFRVAAKGSTHRSPKSKVGR